MDTFSGEATLIFILPPFPVGSRKNLLFWEQNLSFKGILSVKDSPILEGLSSREAKRKSQKLFPFWKDSVLQGSKQEVTKVVSLHKNDGKHEVYPFI